MFSFYICEHHIFRLNVRLLKFKRKKALQNLVMILMMLLQQVVEMSANQVVNQVDVVVKYPCCLNLKLEQVVQVMLLLWRYVFVNDKTLLLLPFMFVQPDEEPLLCCTSKFLVGVMVVVVIFYLKNAFATIKYTLLLALALFHNFHVPFFIDDCTSSFAPSFV